MASKTNTFNMGGRRFRLTPGRVEQRMYGVQPERVTKHYVVVDGMRYPPKQIMAVMTGLPVRDFTTHQALRQCRKLGFVTGQASVQAPIAATAKSDTRLATPTLDDALRAHVGEWVATRGDELLVAAPDAKSVIAWLTRHDLRAESMYRVPEELDQVAGAAAA